MPKKEKVHYIYKIHFLCGFPAGRYYLGKHTGYIDDYYAGSGSFCKAYYKKYGKINGITYIKEILEINPDKKVNAEREVIIIGDLWKTDPLCMNMLSGGDNPGDYSVSTRKKISNALKGNKNGTGHVTSEEDKQKMRELYSKKVLQYDLSGNYIKTFESIHVAAEFCNGYPINISNCCNRKTKTAYDYIWRFENEPLDKNEAVFIVKGKTRIIGQFDLDGNLIKYYTSIKEAAMAVGVKPCTISAALLRNSISAGYRWKYKED